MSDEPMTDPTLPRADEVVMELWQSSHGGYQLSIGVVDENGAGHGYRIFGSKFDGSSSLLRRQKLDERDASEIRGYLDRLVAPGSPTVPEEAPDAR